MRIRLEWRSYSASFHPSPVNGVEPGLDLHFSDSVPTRAAAKQVGKQTFVGGSRTVTWVRIIRIDGLDPNRAKYHHTNDI